MKMDKKWETMTVDEKQEEMFRQWLSPEGITFASPEAEKAYKDRVTRIKDAIQMKKLPDRVPIIPMTGFFPGFYSGMTPYDAMYDYAKTNAAWKKFAIDFQPDAHLGTFTATPGKVFEILDYRLYAWPGHGVSPKHSYQCIEGEYMKADEYDMLIEDPTNYFLTRYLPRVFGVFAPFTTLSPFTNIQEIYAGFSAVNFIPFGLPPMQNSLKTIMEAGNEALKWVGFNAAYEKDMVESGFPNGFGGGSKAPFDVIGDTLRGTKGIMLDLYRQPDKLLKALERITPLAINMAVSACKMNRNPIAFLPLHKGADGFMSDEQFKKFYWPTFRELLMGIINEGCVPFSFVEGGYNTRLDIIKDMPKGKTVWTFDATDMEKAKKILGKTACIGGNIPTSLLTMGTADAVKEYVKKLIDTAGKGGGYIMSNGAVIDECKPENLKLMIDFSKEYGVYK
jgi:hypothetical protein